MLASSTKRHRTTHSLLSVDGLDALASSSLLFRRLHNSALSVVFGLLNIEDLASIALCSRGTITIILQHVRAARVLHVPDGHKFHRGHSSIVKSVARSLLSRIAQHLQKVVSTNADLPCWNTDETRAIVVLVCAHNRQSLEVIPRSWFERLRSTECIAALSSCHKLTFLMPTGCQLMNIQPAILDGWRECLLNLSNLQHVIIRSFSFLLSGDVRTKLVKHVAPKIRDLVLWSATQHDVNALALAPKLQTLEIDFKSKTERVPTLALDLLPLFVCSIKTLSASFLCGSSVPSNSRWYSKTLTSLSLTKIYDMREYPIFDMPQLLTLELEADTFLQFIPCLRLLPALSKLQVSILSEGGFDQKDIKYQLESLPSNWYGELREIDIGPCSLSSTIAALSGCTQLRSVCVQVPANADERLVYLLLHQLQNLVGLEISKCDHVELYNGLLAYTIPDIIVNSSIVVMRSGISLDPTRLRLSSLKAAAFDSGVPRVFKVSNLEYVAPIVESIWLTNFVVDLPVDCKQLQIRNLHFKYCKFNNLNCLSKLLRLMSHLYYLSIEDHRTPYMLISDLFLSYHPQLTEVRIRSQLYRINAAGRDSKPAHPWSIGELRVRFPKLCRFTVDSA